MYTVRFPVVVLLFLLGGAALGQGRAPRQYYSSYWKKQGGYYYRHYYYKPRATDAKYKSHVVIYYPSRPGHYYYYNPYKATFWGRYERRCGGYSTLAPKDRRSTIADIPAGAFPEAKPNVMGTLPESEDNVAMVPLSADLPPDESLELTKERMRELVAAEDAPLPKQVYSGWCKHSESAYFFSVLYFESGTGGVYTSQRCIYYPDAERFVFLYDPAKGQYWGRYDKVTKEFSILDMPSKRVAGRDKDFRPLMTPPFLPGTKLRIAPPAIEFPISLLPQPEPEVMLCPEPITFAEYVSQASIAATQGKMIIVFVGIARLDIVKAYSKKHLVLRVDSFPGVVGKGIVVGTPNVRNWLNRSDFAADVGFEVIRANVSRLEMPRMLGN